MKHPRLKDWIAAFIQKLAYVSIFYIIALLVSKNAIFEGFKEKFWLLCIGY